MVRLASLSEGEVGAVVVADVDARAASNCDSCFFCISKGMRLARESG